MPIRAIKHFLRYPNKRSLNKRQLARSWPDEVSRQRAPARVGANRANKPRSGGLLRFSSLPPLLETVGPCGAALGFGWADVTATRVYSIFDIHPLLADEFVQPLPLAEGFDAIEPHSPGSEIADRVLCLRHGTLWRILEGVFSKRDHEFESASLQRRLCKLSAPACSGSHRARLACKRRTRPPLEKADSPDVLSARCRRRNLVNTPIDFAPRCAMLTQWDRPSKPNRSGSNRLGRGIHWRTP